MFFVIIKNKMKKYLALDLAATSKDLTLFYGPETDKLITQFIHTPAMSIVEQYANVSNYTWPCRKMKIW